MLWFLFAISASVLWAISNLIDGDLVLNRVKNPLVIVTVTGLFSILPFLYECLIGNFSFPPLLISLFGIFLGFLSLMAFYPYFRALEHSHPASAVLLWNLSPVLIAITAFVFLGERLLPTQYLAISLIVCSAMLVSGGSRSQKAKGQKGSSAVAWMLLASLFTASEALLSKWLFGHASSGTVIGLISLGSFVLSLVLLCIPSIRKSLRTLLPKHGGVFALNETLNNVAFVCSAMAVSLGPVSLVKAIEGTQAFFVLACSWVAVRLFSRKQFHVARPPRAGVMIVACSLALVGLMLM